MKTGALSNHDDAILTNRRRHVLRHKPFLRDIYREWYRRIAEDVPEGDGPVLEIGSGPGFARSVIPNLISSEFFFSNDIHIVLDARRLPFGHDTFKAVVMTNVLHHLPDARAFFREALRCMREGGRIVMIEPWVTPWSKFVFRLAGHEPLDTETVRWEFESASPIGCANQALPWIVFKRDRALFGNEFPSLKFVRIEPFMPFRYLLSGGFSGRSMMPGFLFGFWERLEKRIAPINPVTALFARIVLEKRIS